jgi:predicted lipoprotein with Yx(FWY)xxD motif
MSTAPNRLNRRTRISFAAVAAGLIALAVLVVGCGSGSGSGGSYGKASSSAATPAPAPAGSPTVKLASTGLGKVLVDSQGRTLYLFEADKGTKSACDGACANIWPPLVTKGKPTAGPGLTASALGTTKRSDGATELTYNGHPLYTYAGDTAAGQTSGQGLDDYGAEWYALSARGDKIDNG